jgi:hypothetical protein
VTLLDGQTHDWHSSRGYEVSRLPARTYVLYFYSRRTKKVEGEEDTKAAHLPFYSMTISLIALQMVFVP